MYDNATKVVGVCASACTSVCVRMQRGWIYENASFSFALFPGRGRRKLFTMKEAAVLVAEIGRAEILTHQLFTCKMVRPVSAASCFFCSSEGYGCCRNKHKDTYTHVLAPLTYRLT